jgi:hypothetical protein
VDKLINYMGDWALIGIFVIGLSALMCYGLGALSALHADQREEAFLKKYQDAKKRESGSVMSVRPDAPEEMDKAFLKGYKEAKKHGLATVTSVRPNGPEEVEKAFLKKYQDAKKRNGNLVV